MSVVLRWSRALALVMGGVPCHLLLSRCLHMASAERPPMLLPSALAAAAARMTVVVRLGERSSVATAAAAVAAAGTTTDRDFGVRRSVASKEKSLFVERLGLHWGSSTQLPRHDYSD